jgi:uncharacterized protein YcnI
MIRALRIAVVAIGVAAVGVLAYATPASAHVTVNPREATQGGYARLAFRVPNESDTASTVKLEVHLPQDTPVASVSTMPVPGWTVTATKAKLAQPIDNHGTQITEAVSVVTWTAVPGAGVKPGEFQEFPISVGPLPEADQMVFKALQTYSDGEVARWIEDPVPGAEEPEHPAPVLKLQPEAAAGGDAAAPGPAAAAPPDDSGSGAALGLGIAGLVAGLAGLVLGGLAFTRSRGGPAALAPASGPASGPAVAADPAPGSAPGSAPGKGSPSPDAA